MFKAIFQKNRKSLFILLIVLTVVCVTQIQNLFQYPYYQDAEGTQIANSWSVLTGGDLSPYTYAYEEPPAGTFLLTGWAALAKNLPDFGFAINAGRVLMFMLHLAGAALVYGITYKITKNDFAAATASLIFTFSPLAASFHRLVLPDNIMVVWFLTAFYLILGEKRTLYHYLLSAAFFALAVLTKFACIGFLPVYIYIIRQKSDPHHRAFATTLWGTLAVLLIGFYPLYAQMRQELFPQGWLLGGDFPHVSLLERLADRGPDTGRFLNIGSGLGRSVDLWIDLENPTADPILIYGGLISTLFVFLMALDNRKLRPVVAMTFGYALYLFVRAPIFNTDILIFLPLLAINIGLLVGGAAKWFSNLAPGAALKFVMQSGAVVVLLYPFWIFYSNRLEVYTLNQVDGQIDAVEWVSGNVPEDAVIVTDNYAFTELRTTLPNTHHYWKVDTDPAVKFNILDGDWCNIDYVLTTPQVYSDIDVYNMEVMRAAMDNSELLIEYENNGWPIQIRQVSKKNCVPEVASREQP